MSTKEGEVVCGLIKAFSALPKEKKVYILAFTNGVKAASDRAKEKATSACLKGIEDILMQSGAPTRASAEAVLTLASAAEKLVLL